MGPRMPLLWFPEYERSGFSGSVKDVFVCTISKDELDFSDGDVAIEPADDSHGFSLVFAITCSIVAPVISADNTKVDARSAG